MKIGYVTNIPKNQSRGGWDGINRNLFSNILNKEEIEYFHIPIPRPSFFSAYSSAIRRRLGFAGEIPIFSDIILDKIGKEFEEKTDESFDHIIFFGCTPWLSCSSPVPYSSYIDATIDQYVRVFLVNNGNFCKYQLNRLVEMEVDWLNRAHSVFYGSNWVRDAAALNGVNVDKPGHRTVYLGGNLPCPAEVRITNRRDFLFISWDFQGKGGRLAFQATSQLRAAGFDVRLLVIGERPPHSLLESDSLVYLGALDKSSAADLRKLEAALGSVVALIHPSSKDTMGAVLIEAAYYGTPSICSSKFGIPELVVDGETGLLLKDVSCSHELYSRMKMLLDSPERASTLGKNARIRASTLFTWEAVAEAVRASIKHNNNIYL